MPFYRQNARFDPEGRLSPRCAIPRLPVRHKYIPGIGAATRTPHRYRCCPVSKFHPPPPPLRSIDATPPSTPWTSRRRVGGLVGGGSSPLVMSRTLPFQEVSESKHPTIPYVPPLLVALYLSPPWLQAPSPPTRRRLVTHDPIPTGLPGRWNGSCGRKRKRAHAHVCMQMCAHMLACNHTHPPLCALCLRRRF